MLIQLFHHYTGRVAAGHRDIATRLFILTVVLAFIALVSVLGLIPVLVVWVLCHLPR